MASRNFRFGSKEPLESLDSGSDGCNQESNATECGEPPRIMQSSNLPTIVRLNISHDGSSNETSCTDDESDNHDTATSDEHATEHVADECTNDAESGADEHVTECGEPPLIMRSSNQPTVVRLDIRHDGGGNETSGADDESDNRDTATGDEHATATGDEHATATEHVADEHANDAESIADEHIAECSEPPLIMQSSNLPTVDGLDIRHDGGGNETSDTDDDSDDHDTASDDEHVIVTDEHSSDDEHVADDDHAAADEHTAADEPSADDEHAAAAEPAADDEHVIVTDEHVAADEPATADKHVVNEHATGDKHVVNEHDTGDKHVVNEHASATCDKHVVNEHATASDNVIDDEHVADDEHVTDDDDDDDHATDDEIASDDEHVIVDDSCDDYNQDDEIEPPKKKLKSDHSDVHGAVPVNCHSDNSVESSFSFFTHSCSEQNSGGKSTDSKKNNVSDMPISSELETMEFDILDDANSNDNDGSYLSDSSGISLGELDAMLEAGFKNSKNSSGEPLTINDLQHEEKQKVILKVRGRDHFDVLPEGWIEVTHNSGMPIYLHKVSRVCSVSKPYFLGPGSTRKHEIPVSAIPCLHYLKELEKEKNKQEEEESKVENSDYDHLPSAKLESVKDTKESGSLSYMAVREYCMKRFEFQTITIKRFKTWCGRRMHQKQLKLKQRPTLPDNTKLITCPLPAIVDKNSASGTSTKREFIMNPSGKSPVCILHEYVQHTLRVQPKYIFKELENASTPYGAVVIIDDMEYGSGYGSSKKQAKSEAAKSALDVLIPKMNIFGSDRQKEEHQDVAFFDEVRVEDPRVCELSVKAGQPYPYQILLECLKRNYGMGDTEVYLSMHNLKHQKNEFIMQVGKHSVSVICKNKRDGKHRASQAILQLLHPHVNSWGSLLRMYGKGSCKTLKEKKEEEQRITELQSQACANKPNMSILNKLKEEMLKYREKMKMKKPIGKLIPEQMEFSTSDSNLKNVEL